MILSPPNEARVFRDEAGRSLFGPCFGERGVLTQFGRKVQCHICGKTYLMLGLHVRLTHEMSVQEYKREFGLARRSDYDVGGKGLASEWYAKRLDVLHSPLLTSEVVHESSRSTLKSLAAARPVFTKRCHCGNVVTWRGVGESATCGKACGSKNNSDWHTGRSLSEETKHKIGEKARVRMTPGVARRMSAMRKPCVRRATCKRGHELTPENTFMRVTKNGTVVRRCVTCRKQYWESHPVYLYPSYRKRCPIRAAVLMSSDESHR
mgnify:CR=1 FL=1